MLFPDKLAYTFINIDQNGSSLFYHEHLHHRYFPYLKCIKDKPSCTHALNTLPHLPRLHSCIGNSFPCIICLFEMVLIDITKERKGYPVRIKRLKEKAQYSCLANRYIPRNHGLREYRSLYSDYGLQVKFWSFVFETWFGNNQRILLHWLYQKNLATCEGTYFPLY